MDQTEQRIGPLEQSELPRAAVEALDGWAVKGKLNNIFLTLARHPALLVSWMPFGTHTFGGSTLPSRLRELVILRTGWRCASAYEFTHHVRIARRIGVTDEDVARVKVGAGAEGWTPQEDAALRAVDELEDLAVITSATWSALAASLTTEQMMDLVYTFGAYRTTAAAMNSFGVGLEDGFEASPDIVQAAAGRRA